MDNRPGLIKLQRIFLILLVAALAVSTRALASTDGVGVLIPANFLSSQATSAFSRQVDWSKYLSDAGHAVPDLRLDLSPQVSDNLYQLQWNPSERLSLWTAGYSGEGRIHLGDSTRFKSKSSSILTFGLAGGKYRFYSTRTNDEWTTLHLKGEAWESRILTATGDSRSELELNRKDARLSLEGRQAFRLNSGHLVEPSLEFGMRWGRNGNETEFGTEMESQMSFTNMNLGLKITTSARLLLWHDNDTRREAVGLSVGRLPDANGRGLSYNVKVDHGHNYGTTNSLWDQGTIFHIDRANLTTRVDTEVAYGIRSWQGLVTPYFGVGTSENKQNYRLGTRITVGPAFQLGFEGEKIQRYIGNNTSDTNLRLMLRALIGW